MMVALLFLAAFLVLPAIYLRDSALERRRRADWFAPALSLFSSYRVTQHGKNWPVLFGGYCGRNVRLEPVLDDLTWRKLPSLWLKVTLLEPNPARGTYGFLVRARGGEFYSPTPDMKHRLPIPQHWPADALFCSDDREQAPKLDMSAFADPRMKELVVSPLGVRLVYQADQGERASYLVLRQARFAEPHANPVGVKALLDQLIAIAAELDGQTALSAAA
jgi:hypothetical protein